MKTSDFDYFLPPELIAQSPAQPRDSSRLLVLHRREGRIEHRRFFDLPEYLSPGDALVLNDTRVLPARLHGRRESGGKVELLLLHRLTEGRWQCLVKPGKKASVGTRLLIGDAGAPVSGEIVATGAEGLRTIQFSAEATLFQAGTVPLPPYIRAPLTDAERYQTVYARVPGSAAAPTAGLHFTPQLLEAIAARGVNLVFLTLHIGLDTFRPVREEDLATHTIHREYAELSTEAAEALNQAKQRGNRVIGVGTTSVRVVETAAQSGRIGPFQGWCDLFILPGYRFRAVDGLVTNFHLPRSTNLMLTCAFAGREPLLSAYHEAIAQRYRFYSFGDGMLVL